MIGSYCLQMTRCRFALAVTALVLAGCGAARHAAPPRPAPPIPVQAAAGRTQPVPPIRALVTAQTENRLLVTALPGGRVVRAVTIPGDPAYVDATSRVVVVVSSNSGTVTLLDRRTLRVIKAFRGFSSPHIPAISPDGRYAYVTDDGTGELSVIRLYDHRLLSRVFVGAGAHHLAFSPDERRVWVALSQSAQTLTLLSTMRLGYPRVIGHIHPPFLAHDLLFTPAGDVAWVTAASASYVGVFDVRTGRLLFRIPAGVGPQHLAFSGGYAYVTSGYGSSIERVDLDTGRVIRKVYAPYGSFDLDAGGGYVVTASLLRGTLAIYNDQLRLLRVAQLAPSTEDVALSAP